MHFGREMLRTAVHKYADAANHYILTVGTVSPLEMTPRVLDRNATGEIALPFYDRPSASVRVRRC